MNMDLIYNNDYATIIAAIGKDPSFRLPGASACVKHLSQLPEWAITPSLRRSSVPETLLDLPNWPSEHGLIKSAFFQNAVWCSPRNRCISNAGACTAVRRLVPPLMPYTHLANPDLGYPIVMDCSHPMALKKNLLAYGIVSQNIQRGVWLTNPILLRYARSLACISELESTGIPPLGCPDLSFPVSWHQISIARSTSR